MNPRLLGRESSPITTGPGLQSDLTFTGHDVDVGEKDVVGLARLPGHVSHVRLRVRIGGPPTLEFRVLEAARRHIG